MLGEVTRVIAERESGRRLSQRMSSELSDLLTGYLRVRDPLLSI